MYLLSDHMVANHDKMISDLLLIFRKTVWNSTSQVTLALHGFALISHLLAVCKEIPVHHAYFAKSTTKRFLMEILDTISVYLNIIINLWLIPDTDIKVQLFLYLAF